MNASSSSQNVSSKRKKQEKDDESSLDVSNDFATIKSVLNYILVNSIFKHPIKKSDIVSKILKGNNKIFTDILETVRTHLKELYDINLIEIPNSKPIAYICTSTAIGSVITYTEKEQKDITLLFIILSYIYMKRSVTEEVLYRFLERLNIKMDETHSYFGSNLKKKINDTFIKQLYLKKEKKELEASNDQQIIFSWGFRSTLEFPKQEIFKKVCMLLGRPEESFPNQYKEIYGDDEDDEDVEMLN